MSVFYLVRHGSTNMIGRGISGRTPNVHLNETGCRQAQALGAVLARFGIQRIYCSPLERARETAEPCATALGVLPMISDDLNEVNFGKWTGRNMRELESLEAWKQWNQFRSGVRIPLGESMLEVQARMVGEMQRLQAAHPNEVIAIFSHGDPIRAALMYWLGMSLDLVFKIEISLASFSVVEVHDWGAVVKAMNVTASP